MMPAETSAGDLQAQLRGFWRLNALNRANLNGFGSSIVIGSTSNFGQIQSAENLRIIQIGLRFAF